MVVVGAGIVTGEATSPFRPFILSFICSHCFLVGCQSSVSVNNSRASIRASSSFNLDMLVPQFIISPIIVFFNNLE